MKKHRTDYEIARHDECLALVSIRRLLPLRNKDPMARRHLKCWINDLRAARAALTKAWCGEWIEKNVPWQMRADYIHT